MSHQRLLKHQNSRFRSTSLILWGMLTDYGQSLFRWISLFIIMTFVILPILYSSFSSAGTSLNYIEIMLYTIGRSVSFSPYTVTLNTGGNIIAIFQAIFSIIWFGAAVAIIVGRNQE